MTVKQLQTKLDRLKARIVARQSELANLRAEQKETREKLAEAKKKKVKPK